MRTPRSGSRRGSGPVGRILVSRGRTRYPQHVSTAAEHLSEKELFELACRPRDSSGWPQVEFLGACTIEEALEMGAWFDDPDEQAAFERAVEARGLRLP